MPNPTARSSASNSVKMNVGSDASPLFFNGAMTDQNHGVERLIAQASTELHQFITDLPQQYRAHAAHELIGVVSHAALGIIGPITTSASCDALRKRPYEQSGTIENFSSTSAVETTAHGGIVFADKEENVGQQLKRKVSTRTDDITSNHNDTSGMKCVPLDPATLPPSFDGDVNKAKKIKLGKFLSLANFPPPAKKGKLDETIPESHRMCIMCGEICPFGIKPASSVNGSKVAVQYIPTQNKGVCNSCDTLVFRYDSRVDIKWCKGCKTFLKWVDFMDKGNASKCHQCREQQKLKYAAKKRKKNQEAMPPA